jgi:CheY-like chemotaxis protein
MHAHLRPVLVVDDEPSFRFLMATLLERAGFAVVATASVDEALAVFRSHPLLFVVSDYALGRATGLDLLRAVRAEQPALPFVLVSADLPPGVGRLALEEGAERVVGKSQIVSELAGLAEQIAA